RDRSRAQTDAEAPAQHGSVRSQGTHGVRLTRQLNDSSKTADCNRGTRVLLRPVAQLSELVVPPTFHCAPREEHARVPQTCGDRRRSTYPADAGRRTRRRIDAGVRDLTAVIRPPASNLTIYHDRASVGRSGSDRADASEAGDGGRKCEPGHGAPDSPLAKEIVAPTNDSSARLERTRVVAAERDGAGAGNIHHV